MIERTNARAGARIRGAKAEDTGRIIQVVNEAFAVEDFIDGTRTDEGRFAEMTRKGKFFVANVPDGRIVACIFAELRGERGYFGMLAVDPREQGNGLGRLMIEFAEHYCRERGCQWMDISVLTLRPELLPFYQKLGYAETRHEEFFPSRPLKKGVECKSIVMSKKL
ncbi:MAG TPA: GNAT family N-acetyltransferase [Verrucomicrobiae bacterium]|nr:GNAT family N-acetyltransferase [Verrucomicrobiae bacterium]